MNASISRTPATRARVDHRWASAAVMRQRLLAQDVLARLGRRDRPLGVEVVRQRDVDGVDVGVGEQRLVRAVGARDAQPPATRPAGSASREAIATISQPRRRADARDRPSSPRCRRWTGSPSAARRSGSSDLHPACDRDPYLTWPRRCTSLAHDLQERNTNLVMIGRDELGHRSETVRRANLSAIVRELHGSGPLSRSDLVARTGLTRSAIRGLIGELVAGGLVTEGPADPRRHAGPALAARPPEPARRRRARPRDRSSTRSPRPSVGLGGEVFDRVRVDLPRGRIERRRHRRGPGGARRRRSATGCAPTDRSSASASPSSASSGGATAWCPWPRTSAGATSRSASASPARSASTLPIAFANEADLGVARRAPPRRGRGASTTSCSSGARSASAAALIVDGAAADRRRRLRRRGRPHPGQPGRRCRVAAGRSAAGRPRSASGALLASRRLPPEAGRGACDAVLARRRGRVDPTALAALAETGRWLGIGLAGLVNILNPRARRARRSAARADLPVRPLDAGGRARPARPAAPRAGSCASSPATLGVDAPLLGRGRAGVRTAARRSGGLAAAAAGHRPRWRAHEARRHERSVPRCRVSRA